MTTSGTRNQTFTIVQARYVGAKVGADLRFMNGLYGRPTLARISDYAEEVALLLLSGYLDTVSYGFKDGSSNEWKFRLRYEATVGGQLKDNPPGSYPPNAEVSQYEFHSFLICSSSFSLETADVRGAFLKTLPFQRGDGTEPTTGSGTTTSGHQYSSSPIR
jgi:hypothetical protein